MKIEHFAFNVSDPVPMSAWYVEHLGMRVVRHSATAPYTHFLADDSGTVMIEFYRNPPDEVPSYRTMHPLLLHLAFVSEDPAADKTNLLQAGATLVEELHLKDGGHLVMMRDPWGLALQFCKRGTPMRVVHPSEDANE